MAPVVREFLLVLNCSYNEVLERGYSFVPMPIVCSMCLREGQLWEVRTVVRLFGESHTLHWSENALLSDLLVVEAIDLLNSIMEAQIVVDRYGPHWSKVEVVNLHMRDCSCFHSNF